MFERIRNMLRKEFIQIFRDPKMKLVIFLMPVIQVLVFGYAVSTDVRNVPTIVQDLDNSIASRELISRFTGSDYFDIVAYVEDDHRVRAMIDRGEAKAILHI